MAKQNEIERRAAERRAKRKGRKLTPESIIRKLESIRDLALDDALAFQDGGNEKRVAENIALVGQCIAAITDVRTQANIDNIGGLSIKIAGITMDCFLTPEKIEGAEEDDDNS